MKSFLLACAAVIVIAIIGAFALNEMQISASQAYSTEAVRLGA